MDDFTVRSCTRHWPARRGARLRSRILGGGPSKTIGKPCVSEVPLLGIRWRPLSQGSRPHRHRQNLTVSLKPFKKLVKTNNFTIRSMEVPDHAAERCRRRTEASWRPWQESGSASAPPHTYQVSKRAFWESPRTAGWHGDVDTVLYWGPEGGEGGTRNV